MLFPSLVRPVSDFVSASLSTAGTPIVLAVAFIDQEIGAVLAGIFSYMPTLSPKALCAAAAIAGFLRSIGLYELARRNSIHLGDAPQSLSHKLQYRLHSKPLLWVTGLQFCFAFRWTLPVLCAKARIRRSGFYAAVLLGNFAWTGILYAIAHFWLKSCYPGLLGQSEALRAMPGLIILAVVAVVAAKAIARRWAERLQTKKKQH